MNVQDEFHDRITEHDLDLMRKSFAVIVATPFLTVFCMYAAKLLKKDYSMSESFVYQMRRMQDSFISTNYGRKTS